MLMKTRFLLTISLILLGLGVYAQPTDWREDSPAEFAPLTLQGEFDKVSEGKRALKIIFTETGTPYFVSDTFNVTSGASYSYSIDVLDSDAGTEVNQRIRFINADNTGTNATSASYSVDNTNYQTLTLAGTAPATAVKAYVIIRIYDVTASWTGSGTFYLDNAIYTENGGTTNLIPNGGFENWIQPNIPEGGSLFDWIEDSPAEFAPLTIVPEFTQVNHGLVAAKITFTETGTPYFVSDTFNVTAGAAFDFRIDVLDNDAGAEVNQRVRFINADNTGTNLTSSVYTTDNANYQTYSYTGTVPATAVKAYVIIRIYDVSASWTGSGTFYLDNAKFIENAGTTNLIPNASFENWTQIVLPEFLTYKFEALSPMVNGIIDKGAHTVSATVPYATDLTNLVATFTMNEGATAKVGATDQVSGTTPNDFTNAVTYTLTAQDGVTTQNWVVSVAKGPASTAKDIISFRFEGLTPAVNGIINSAEHKVALEVPNETNLTNLVPTITVSQFATTSPLSGVAQNFTTPVTYTVTAQDGSTQTWEVTVTKAAAGRTTLFSEDFEGKNVLPEGWIVINGDGYTQAAGEERWQDSAWVVTTSNRIELQGTNVAMASSYCSNMPLDGKAYDWMILPTINLGGNSTISWSAMSTTSSGNYPDDYMVVIAPAVDGVTPTIAYFEEAGNILIEVKPESWSASVGNPGEGLKNRSINLKNAITADAPNGWKDRKVRIAFVCITDRYTNPTTGIPNATAGGSNIAIDNILVVNDIVNAIDDVRASKLDTKVYPNPATDNIKVKLNTSKAGVAEVVVTDIIGKVIIKKNYTLTLGENILDIDAQLLNSGIYMIKTTINGNTNVSKVIIK